MKHTGFAVAFAIATFIAMPTVAEGVPKFGKTCIGNVRDTTDICLTSNGKTVSSTYKFRRTLPTRGTHTDCAVKGSTLTCSGGRYSTAKGGGKMSPVVIKLKNGAPTSIAWR